MARALVGLAWAVRDGTGFSRLRTVRCDVEMESGLDGVAEAFGLAGVDFGWESWEVSRAPLGRGEGTPDPDWGMVWEADIEVDENGELMIDFGDLLEGLDDGS